MKQWLDGNKLSLNNDKTNFIVFKSPQHLSSETVSIKSGNHQVKQPGYVKFLGVLLEENISWRYHLLELSRARTCCLFVRVRHFLPKNTLTCLYKSLFSPFQHYGIVVWGLTYESYINPVFLLQKRVVSAVSFAHFTSLLHLIFLNSRS